MTLHSIKYRIQDLLFRKFAIPIKIDEKISKKYLKKFLPQQPTIIDCGAHDGSDSVELASTIGGNIYSFEPVPVPTCPNLYIFEISSTEIVVWFIYNYSYTTSMKFFSTLLKINMPTRSISRVTPVEYPKAVRSKVPAPKNE